MITSLHKWYPFVFPTPYDVRSIAFEKRVQRLQSEYEQELKANEIRQAIDELALELYHKRARQTTVEIEIFNNQTHFDKYA
jgi:hypothetical protein